MRTVLRLLTTASALAAGLSWAIAPILTPLVYLRPSSWTDADMIRKIWRVRLLKPEWISDPPDYLGWCEWESVVRLMLVLFLSVVTLRICRRLVPNRKRLAGGGSNEIL